jgi:release factor glutamine methyltransferase
MSTAIFDDHDNAMEARELLAYVLDEDPDDLEDDLEPPRATRERYLALIARRAAGEPFPFLVGYIDFYGLHLRVKPGPFVPRSSSELTVDRAIERMGRKRAGVVVDVCTGSGPIALAIADELPKCEVWGLDIDPNGVQQGRRNARELDIKNVKLRAGDLFEPLPARLEGAVDLITGHIPYVAPHELEDLPAEVIDHEPVFTLSDQSLDGLGLVERAIKESVPWLQPGGWLLLEIADDLTSKVRKMCRRAGFLDEGVATDEDGLSVVVEARKPG